MCLYIQIDIHHFFLFRSINISQHYISIKGVLKTKKYMSNINYTFAFFFGIFTNECDKCVQHNMHYTCKKQNEKYLKLYIKLEKLHQDFFDRV